MKKIVLEVKHFLLPEDRFPGYQGGPYLRYKWFFLKKRVRRVYYEED